MTMTISDDVRSLLRRVTVLEDLFRAYREEGRTASADLGARTELVVSAVVQLQDAVVLIDPVPIPIDPILVEGP